MKLSEIQITPIKPQNGLVAFATLVLDDCLYLGSIGVCTRLQGGYRLTYPTRKTGLKDINIFHPIDKAFAEIIENTVVAKYEELMQLGDRTG